MFPNRKSTLLLLLLLSNINSNSNHNTNINIIKYAYKCIRIILIESVHRVHRVRCRQYSYLDYA